MMDRAVFIDLQKSDPIGIIATESSVVSSIVTLLLHSSLSMLAYFESKWTTGATPNDRYAHKRIRPIRLQKKCND
jgi:hypothetical protein